MNASNQDALGPVATARRRARSRLVSLCSLVALLGTSSLAASQAPQAGSIDRLQTAMQRLVDRFPGSAGVYAIHLESGMRTGVDEDTPYGMASTFKVPILVELMTRVDAGELSLDDVVSVQPEDQHIGSGLLSSLWAPGLDMSLRNLATIMIILSDNSATDMMIDLLGADAVTARMRALGFDDIRVDRTTLELILDYRGVAYDPVADATLEQINEFSRNNRPAANQMDAVRTAFYDGPEDKATARQMTELLAMIAGGEAVSRASSDIILEILSRTQTGAARLRGLLPPGTPIAHKTGTIGRYVADVGIITLPDDLGRFAISVFTMGDEVDTERGEALIAEVGRTAYDFFVFNAPAGGGQ
ncbi:MAG: class A beta-lactamase-related serine hydrolase [Acidobacteriota bacterium]